MTREERTDLGGELDLPDVGCVFCGDEIVKGKCARNCEASRRSEALRVARMGGDEK